VGPAAPFAGKWRILFPAFRESAETPNRKRFHHCLLEPLARRLRLGKRLPAIGHDMAKLVPELIGELRPVLRTDVDNDPGHAAAIRMQPNGGRTGGVLVEGMPSIACVYQPLLISKP
jgi:hypothetical protein